ncbi:hypothetical protein HaLaN_07853, partial [Haematococcus lacustris]
MAAQLRAICHNPWLLVWSKPVAAVGTAALTLALNQGQQQLLAAGQPLCKDPSPGPGPGLAGDSSIALTQEVPAVQVLALTPALALTRADGSVPPCYKTGVEGNVAAAGRMDTLEQHLGVLTRTCTQQ